MSKSFILSVFIQLVCLQSFAAVQIKNLKTNNLLNASVYSANEGFIALDKINSVYGVEIVLKDLPLPQDYKVVNADSPEQDFSFLNKYTMNKNASASADDKGAQKSETPAVPETAQIPLINTTVQGNQVRIVTGSVRTLIKDSAGSDLYSIEWTSDKKGLQVRNCPPDLLRLREIKNLMTTGPMGVSCDFSMTPGLMTISPTKEAKWTSTNMVEVSGKGERFRTFEIPVGNMTGQASGVFRFTTEGKNMTFAVFAKKIEDKVTALSIGFDKTFSFGMNTATLAGGANSAGSSSFFYEFYGLTDFVYRWFKVGFGFYNSFATGEDPAVISSRDSVVNLGYYSDGKNALNYGAWFGHRNYDIKQDLSSTKFQSSQFAFGAEGTYRISNSQKVALRFEMASLGSKVVQSHMKIGLNYNHKLVFGKTEWNTGGVFETETMKLVSTDGTGRDFALTKFGLTLAF